MAFVVVFAWLGSTGQAWAADGRGAGAASSRLVPVWALLDGELPVASARVSVVATTNDPAHVGERRLLRQRNGSRSERTNAAGVALLDFARLPKRFTVVVRGGRAYGQRVPGALYAEVRRRGSDVIEVNPATTLAAFARAAGRGMGTVRARRKVKRMLAIPSWHDTTRDLAHSDKYFDGEAYLAAARRRGSVQALNRVLLAELRDGDRDRRRFRELGLRAAASGDWLKLAPQKLAETVLEQLVSFAFGGLTSRSGSGGLGWLTSISETFGFTSQAQQLAEIQEALEALGKQVTQLQGQIERVYRTIAENQVSSLAHQTDRTLGQIDHALSQLALLANLAPDDPTLPKFAQTIHDYIGSNLLDAPAILHRTLSPGIPLADNVIKATSRAVAASTRVFDPGKQAQVKAAFNYFAVYQSQLAVLLANYWHSKPDTYSQSTIQQSLAQIQRNVSEQRTALKPPLPDGSWIDPATGLMWTFTIDPVSFPTYFAYYYPVSVSGRGLDPVGGRPFTDWRLASSTELYGHTGHIAGSARAYLNAQLGYEDAVRATTWTTDSLVLENRSYEASRDTRMLRLQIFNLSSNQLENLTDPGHQFNKAIPAHTWPTNYYGRDQLGSPEGQAWQASKRVDGLLYVRQPAAGEDYWWGAARAGG